MTARITLFTLAALLMGFFAPSAHAQLSLPEPSPSATVKQKIGFTTLTIDYARPAVKGRVIFGGLVPYGKIWRTGASDATILTITDPMLIGGKSLPAGSYSLFTIPNRGEWTVIVNKHVGGHGLDGYEEKNDVIRFSAKADSSARFYESFTIEVQDLMRHGATIYLNWANTSVHFPIMSNADERISGQIQERLKTATDEEPGVYFQAATYFFEQEKETQQALAWATKAAKLKPVYNYLHLQARLQAQAGDYKNAIITARKASEIASEKKLTEFLTLNNRLIAEWQKK